MSRLSRSASLALAALGLALMHPAQAQTTIIAADFSGNYTNNNLTTLNGGTGFASPFTVTQGAVSSFFKYDSRLNGGGGGGTPTGVGINDADNRAFGLNSNPGTETVQRTLSTPLTVGSTLSFAFDNGYVDSGGGQRFVLGTAANNYAAQFGFFGGQNNYEFNGNQVSGFGFTDGGLNVAFTLNSPTAYTMVATKLNDNTAYTYNGTLGSALALDTITFQTYDPGHNQYHDFYFNNLAVTAPNASAAPEPSQLAGLAFTGLGAFGLVLKARKRRSAVQA